MVNGTLDSVMPASIIRRASLLATSCAWRNEIASVRTSESASSANVIPASSMWRRTLAASIRTAASNPRSSAMERRARVERLVAGDLHLAFGIVHVGERRVVDGRQHRLAARRTQRGHQPQMLNRHGVALLRHDRADLDERVGHVQVADLEPGPGVEVLHEAAGVDEQELQRARRRR